MAKAKKKPAGLRKFKSLLRKIVAVPKGEVDAAVEAGKRKRRKR